LSKTSKILIKICTKRKFATTSLKFNSVMHYGLKKVNVKGSLSITTLSIMALGSTTLITLTIKYGEVVFDIKARWVNGFMRLVGRRVNGFIAM
jgi:hypothetical protein